MGDELPDPLVPPEVDLRDLDGFMLNVERLLASELWALTRTQQDAYRPAQALWCRAWKQMPAASLPDDETVLAAFAELPVARFRKLRALAMRGFILCSDGRFYHRVLAAEALRAWERKKAYETRREADRKRLDEWRKKQPKTRDETPQETPDETRFVAEDTIRDRDSYSVPKGTGATAPPDDDGNLTKQVFSAGLTWLAKATRRAESTCRPLLGKWTKDYGADSVLAVLLAAQRKADRDGLVDPVSWIEAAFRERKPKNGANPYASVPG